MIIRIRNESGIRRKEKHEDSKKRKHKCFSSFRIFVFHFSLIIDEDR